MVRKGRKEKLEGSSSCPPLPTRMCFHASIWRFSMARIASKLPPATYRPFDADRLPFSYSLPLASFASFADTTSFPIRGLQRSQPGRRRPRADLAEALVDQQPPVLPDGLQRIDMAFRQLQFGHAGGRGRQRHGAPGAGLRVVR